MNSSDITHTHQQSDANAVVNLERAHGLKEACYRLGCSRSSLYVLAGQGQITFRKIGGRTVVMESEIMRVLREAPQAIIHTSS